MRETVLLSFASVLKISYVFITQDEHTFLFIIDVRDSSRCSMRKNNINFLNGQLIGT